MAATAATFHLHAFHPEGIQAICRGLSQRRPRMRLRFQNSNLEGWQSAANPTGSMARGGICNRGCRFARPPANGREPSRFRFGGGSAATVTLRTQLAKPNAALFAEGFQRRLQQFVHPAFGAAEVVLHFAGELRAGRLGFFDPAEALVGDAEAGVGEGSQRRTRRRGVAGLG